MSNETRDRGEGSGTDWATLAGSETPRRPASATDASDPESHESSARADDSDEHITPFGEAPGAGMQAIGQDDESPPHADGGTGDRIAHANDEGRSPGHDYMSAFKRARQSWPHGNPADFHPFALGFSSGDEHSQAAQMGNRARVRLVQGELDWRVEEERKRVVQEASPEGGATPAAGSDGGDDMTTNDAIRVSDEEWMRHVQTKLGLRINSCAPYSADKAREAVGQRFLHLGAGWLTNALVAALMNKYEYRLADDTVCKFTREAFSSLVSQAIEEDERAGDTNGRLQAAAARAIEESEARAREADKPAKTGMAIAFALVVGLIGWLVYSHIMTERALDAAAVEQGFASYADVLTRLGASSEEGGQVAVAQVALEALDTANEALEVARDKLTEEREKSRVFISDATSAAQSARVSAVSADAAEMSAASARADAERAQTLASRATLAADSLALELSRANRGLTQLVHGGSCEQVEVVTLNSGATRNKFMCGTDPDKFGVLCLGTNVSDATGCTIAR
jgi:hypothetical protein